nr:MAG TPA: hypothetical protein [Caudoviricetes sp.]
MLQEFKNDIYPRRLWVATSWDDVKGKFSTNGDYEFKEEERAYATTYQGIRRKCSGTLGVLIVFNEYKNIGGSKIVEIVAHESLHAANAIFDELGIEYSLTHDEHAAYMVGWVAKCCWKVLQKEIYKD